MLDTVSVVLERAGSSSFALTPEQDSLKFTTAAVGGFGSCSFRLPGDQRKRLGYLGRLRVTLGSRLLWEGQVEDHKVRYDPAAGETVVQAFGLKRLLEETSVRRVWSKRDLDWHEVPGGLGASVQAGVTRADMRADIGTYLPTDPTKQGWQMAGNGVSVAALGGIAVEAILPINVIRIMGDLVLSGANVGVGKFRAAILYSTDHFSSWAHISDSGYDVSFSVDGTTGGGADHIRAYFFNNSGGALTPTATDIAQFSNIRFLCTSLTEDAAGGFYGGTILRDLIALVPGLTIGVIEDGSDFTIQAIERAVRAAAIGVVQEVAGYHTREWAVWDDGRFDWKTRNLDEAQWIAPLPDLATLDIDTSVDGLARTVYILYTDAASGTTAEASSAATAQRNPYVKQGRTKDTLVEPGFPMTSLSAQQLATKLAGEIGQWVPANGRITISATKQLQNAVGTTLPAACIRAGDNILIPDLPKTDLGLAGRDGETLFHIVSTDCDLQTGLVTLELEGQARRADVLLARLAAATRTLTG